MTYCNNCGHESHCGNNFWKDNIEVCKHCRCEKCEISTKSERIDCKWSPDYEKIGESAMDSMDDMKRVELQQLKAACNF